MNDDEINSAISVSDHILLAFWQSPFYSGDKSTFDKASVQESLDTFYTTHAQDNPTLLTAAFTYLSTFSNFKYIVDEQQRDERALSSKELEQAVFDASMNESRKIHEIAKRLREPINWNYVKSNVGVD